MVSITFGVCCWSPWTVGSAPGQLIEAVEGAAEIRNVVVIQDVDITIPHTDHHEFGFGEPKGLGGRPRSTHDETVVGDSMDIGDVAQLTRNRLLCYAK